MSAPALGNVREVSHCALAQLVPLAIKGSIIIGAAVGGAIVLMLVLLRLDR